MQASFEYALSATEPATGAGSNAADPRLMELLFGGALRIYLHESDASLTGWPAAPRDPLVGRSLALLHADPARDWTVPGLARAVAVSRTVLVDRFNEMLGVPPIRYLTEWRLNLAAGLLRTTTSPLPGSRVAFGCGAEDAFSRPGGGCRRQPAPSSAGSVRPPRVGAPSKSRSVRSNERYRPPSVGRQRPVCGPHRVEAKHAWVRGLARSSGVLTG